MIFENSSLKGIFGQNMSYPPKWSLTDDSRFLQAAILKSKSNWYLLISVSLNTTYKASFQSSFKGIVPDIANYSTQSGRSGRRWKTKKAKNMYVKDSLKAKLDVSKALSC